MKKLSPNFKPIINKLLWLIQTQSTNASCYEGGGEEIYEFGIAGDNPLHLDKLTEELEDKLIREFTHSSKPIQIIFPSHSMYYSDYIHAFSEQVLTKEERQFIWDKCFTQLDSHQLLCSLCEVTSGFLPHFVEFVCQIEDPIPLDNLLTEVLGFSKVPADVIQSVHTIMQTYNLGTEPAYNNQIYTLLEGHLDLRTLLEFHPYFPGMHHTNPQGEPLFLENTSHVELLPISSAHICAKYPVFSLGETILLENFVNDFASLFRNNPVEGIYDIAPIKKLSGFQLMIEMDGNRMEQLDLLKKILEDTLELYNSMLLDIPSEDRENHLKKGFDYIKLSNTTNTNNKASGKMVKI